MKYVIPFVLGFVLVFMAASFARAAEVCPPGQSLENYQTTAQVNNIDLIVLEGDSLTKFGVAMEPKMGKLPHDTIKAIVVFYADPNTAKLQAFNHSGCALGQIAVPRQMIETAISGINL